MNGNEIGVFEHLPKVDQLEAAREMRIGIDVGIVSDDIHPHRLTLPRDLAADPAKADHAEGFP